MVSCDINSIDKPLLAEHATRLLASDSAKNWSRIARSEDGNDIEFDDCTSGSIMSFWSYNNEYNLYLVGRETGCDPTLPADTLIRATWTSEEDVDGKFTNVIVLTDAIPAITQIAVQQITSANLQIEYEDSGVLVNETFTYEAPQD